jgi:hypothetical protein
MGGGEVQAPDGYVKTAGNRPGNRRPEHAQGPRKKATFEHTRLPPPKSFDTDGSKQPEVESPRPPKRNDPPRPTRKVSRQRTLAEQKLERARQLAPRYPDLRDVDAWRKLGHSAKRKSDTEHAFVYRHLRLDQQPQSLAFKEWKIRVHREMEGLGLEYAYTGPHVNQLTENEVKADTASGESEMAVVTAQKEEESRRRMEVETMIADDGFDIDIYGDEETRRKYEPWIRSRMDRA